MNCNCASQDLFNFGCRCGAFRFEQNLHVWFNGLDYVVAKNETEANWWLCSYLGKDVSSQWEALPDGQNLIINVENGGDTVKTAADWTIVYGPGFLASLDDAITGS